MRRGERLFRSTEDTPLPSVKGWQFWRWAAGALVFIAFKPPPQSGPNCDLTMPRWDEWRVDPNLRVEAVSLRPAPRVEVVVEGGQPGLGDCAGDYR